MGRRDRAFLRYCIPRTAMFARLHKTPVSGGTSMAGWPKRLVMTVAVSIVSNVVMAGGGIPGVQAFKLNGTWLAPKGISVVQVEMWGGGGGSCHPFSGPDTAGGSGEYVKTRIKIKGGQLYTVTIG